MYKYIIIIILVLILYYLFYCVNIEHFDEYSIWSQKWTKLDFKAREDADCEPIKKEYKKLGTLNSWIWTMPISCENGMPHTRDFNVIAIPEGFPSERLAKTIEHEKIHLHQRLNPELWRAFYRNYWDYEIYDKPPPFMPSSLIDMKRANPDTNDAPFACWRKTWWSVPVYKNSENLKFRDCIVKWWNQETNKIYSNPPTEWISFFGSKVSQTEHPHEISAVYIANLLFDEIIIPDSIKGMSILSKKWNSKKEILYA